MAGNIDAGVLVFDNNKILLVRERGGVKTLPGGKSFEKPSAWGLPGGRGEPGDKDEIAVAEREVEEETGLLVDINDRLKEEIQRDGYKKIVFIGYPVAGKIKINPEEIIDCRWFPRGILHDSTFNMYSTHRQMA